MICNTNLTVWQVVDKVYQELGDRGYVGAYGIDLRPAMMVGDPQLVKRILVYDSHYFHQHWTGDLSEGEQRIDMLNSSHTKAIRSILKPSFTWLSMRRMFPAVEEKTDVLIKHLMSLYQQQKPFVSMKACFSRYVIDAVASCAFGIKTNAIENEDDEICKKAAQLMESNSTQIMMKALAQLTLPNIVLSALAKRFTTPVICYFHDLINETLKKRQESGERRGDFLDMMLEREEQMYHDGKTQDPVEDIAQTSLFLAAGCVPTSNTLTFAAFLLAAHPHEQQHLRQEVLNIRQEHGCLTYQTLMHAPYLDAVVSETLRLHPPAVLTERVCSNDYYLPGTGVVLRKGHLVTIPIWSLQHDSRYWRRPHAFDPDRFLQQHRRDITSGTYLPFGLGPRNCIGKWFALLVVKLALAKMVESFELRPDPRQHQLQYSMLAMSPRDDVRVFLSPFNPQDIKPAEDRL
nr:cytochrome P450 3A13-like [Procambarus clarkii]